MIDPTKLRKRLLANGYTPLANKDKRCFLPGWPKLEVTDELIDKWGRMKAYPATGIRVEHGLCVIDIDIDDARVTDPIIAFFDTTHGDRGQALVRYGSGGKAAMFLRCDEPFGRIGSRLWRKGGDQQTHMIEVFGGATPRQFGAFGPHTVDEKTGEVEIEYRWANRSPLDAPLNELPKVSKDDIYEIVRAAEDLLTREGYNAVASGSGGTHTGEMVFDLTDNMVFRCNDSTNWTLEELEDGAPDGLRCDASFHEEGASNRTRCLIGQTKDGAVTIWDSASDTTHARADLRPVEGVGSTDTPVLDLPAPQDADTGMFSMEPGAQNIVGSVQNGDLVVDGERYTPEPGAKTDPLTPRVGDTAAEVAAKLTQLYGFMPANKNGPVVSLTAADPWETCMTMGNFRLMYRRHTEERQGPRGGVVKVHPVDLWLDGTNRVTVAGIRMEPSQPYPLYEENGKTYVNTYRPPQHDAAGGDAGVGLDFMTHLIPDAAERSWFLSHLAHKVLHPEVPGPGVIMVAHNVYGAGRGTLFDLLRRLFGRAYVSEIPYEMMGGSQSQSQYNDWLDGALWVTVNESSALETGQSNWRAKHNVYERLKQIVDVQPTDKRIIRKGLSSYMTTTHASFLIATNHRDAIPIPEDDRRFTVINNGGPMAVGMAQDVHNWMASPSNVAAFYELLPSFLKQYDPYAPPPMFEGKRVMVNENVSDLDMAFTEAVAEMPSSFMTHGQLLRALQKLKSETDYQLPHGWEDMIKRALMPHKLINTRVRLQHDGQRFRVYTRGTEEDAAAFRAARKEDQLQLVLANGAPTFGPGANVINLKG